MKFSGRTRVAFVMVLAALAAIGAWSFTGGTPAARADASYPGNTGFYDWGSGSDGGGLYQNRSNTTQTDWMKWIDDETPIGDLSIPGTHDSMSAHGGDVPQTQGLCGDSGPADITPCDLTEQLNSGIRFFDIRVACLDNVRTDYKDDLTIWHGNAYQYATLRDVLDAYRAFLTAHPQEAVLMRIASEKITEVEHESCEGDLAGYESYDEKLFADYYSEYSDIFWTNNGQYPTVNTSTMHFPKLGETRGKVVAMTAISTNKRWGLHWEVETTSFDDYNKNVANTGELEQHWIEAANKGLNVASDGIGNRPVGDKQIFHTGLNGSGGLFPNTVAFGDGVSYPGVNYYALEYLMNRGLGSTGIVGMDFPGPGLINAIIAYNLKDADLADADKRAALQTSFAEIVQRVGPAFGNHEDSWARTRVCDAVTCGAGATTGFFNHVMPGQSFHAMAANEYHAYIDHDGLYGRSVTDNLDIMVWNATEQNVVPLADLQYVVDQSVLTEGTRTERALAVYNGLRSAFPGTLWHVVAKKVTDDSPDDDVHMYAHYSQFHKGEWHGYTYYAAGYSPGTLTGAVSRPAAQAVAGQPVTYRATFSPNEPCVEGSCRPTVAGQVNFTSDYVTVPACSAAPLLPNADGTATATCVMTHDAAGTYDIVAWSSGGGWQNAATAALSSAVLNPIPVQVSGTQTYGDSSPSWAYAPRAALPSGVQIEGTLTCTRTRTAPISPALPKGTYTAEPSACSGLRLAGTNAAANVLVYVAGSFEVTPAPLMVTASSAAMTYGGTPPIVTPSYAGFVNGEDASDLLRRPACESGADSRSSVGTYPSTCHGAAAQNYSIQHTAGQITVLPAPLTVTASSPGTTYGDALPIVTPRFFGFVNSDDTSDLAQQPICTTAADERSPAGNYRTECAGARSLNYAVIAIEGTHSIAKAPLTITASGPVMTYGDPAPAVTALYAGFVKGEDAGALSAQPTCSTSAGPRTHVGDSPRTTCRDASADSYALTYVDGFVTVVPRPLLVTASSGSAPYGTPPTVTALYSGFANGETSLVLDTLPTCSTAATASTGVGPYPTRCTGGADSDYRLTYAEGSWTVTRAPLTITAPDASSVYGQDPPTLVPSYSGFVNREGPGVLTSPARCRTEATSGSDAGTYPTVCAQAAADNYELRYVDGVLTVAQAPLSVVAGNQSRPYDEADPLFTWQLVGFVNDDTAAEVGGEPVLHTDATLSSPVGTYPIVVETGSLVAHNYRFVPTNGTLTIVKAVTQVLNTQADMARSAGAPYGWVAATVRYGTADKPVVGLPVTFTSSGRVLCSATTDAAGYARCSLTDRTHRSMIARDGFVASFAGGQNFLASSATGSVN